MYRSVRLAFCSLSAAVSVVLIFLTGAIPIGTYAIPALAALPQLAVVIEFGTGWSWPVYAAVSLLSFFLAGDKEALLWYVLFFGCYPAVKSALERKSRKPVSVFLKLVFFNAAAIAEFCLAMWLLNVPESSYSIFGVCLPWLFLVAGNIVFAVYDYALSLLAAAYFRKVHPRVAKWLKPR